MKHVHSWRTTFGNQEIQNIVSAISHEKISQGTMTEEFETRIAAALQVPYAVATTSGSVALLMAFMAHDIRRGDEVIIPNRTFIATAHAVILAGATVRLVDVRPDRPTVDTSQILSCLSDKTKAIVPVHLNGRSCDMEAIEPIADEYGLVIIEDACQALFSKTQFGFLGTSGGAGCFSLGMTKLISTGQGGLVVTNNADTYRRLKEIRNHGNVETHGVGYHQLGFNFKFTDLQAAIGLAQLQRVPERLDHLTAIYSKYANCIAELPFIDLIPVDVEHGEVPIYVEALCEERDRLRAFMSAQGVDTQLLRPSLSYSGHLQDSRAYPNSDPHDRFGIQLPSGPGQPLSSVERTLEVLRAYGAKHARLKDRELATECA